MSQWSMFSQLLHREISAELDKLTTMLDKLHNKMAGKFDEVS